MVVFDLVVCYSFSCCSMLLGKLLYSKLLLLVKLLIYVWLLRLNYVGNAIVEAFDGCR